MHHGGQSRPRADRTVAREQGGRSALRRRSPSSSCSSRPWRLPAYARIAAWCAPARAADRLSGTLGPTPTSMPRTATISTSISTGPDARAAQRRRLMTRILGAGPTPSAGPDDYEAPPVPFRMARCRGARRTNGGGAEWRATVTAWKRSEERGLKAARGRSPFASASGAVRRRHQDAPSRWPWAALNRPASARCGRHIQQSSCGRRACGDGRGRRRTWISVRPMSSSGTPIGRVRLPGDEQDEWRGRGGARLHQQQAAGPIRRCSWMQRPWESPYWPGGVFSSSRMGP